MWKIDLKKFVSLTLKNLEKEKLNLRNWKSKTKTWKILNTECLIFIFFVLYAVIYIIEMNRFKLKFSASTLWKSKSKGKIQTQKNQTAWCWHWFSSSLNWISTKFNSPNWKYCCQHCIYAKRAESPFWTLFHSFSQKIAFRFPFLAKFEKRKSIFAYGFLSWKFRLL